MPARTSIFLGKGGVGRTTLACAFAVDRAAAGERVLLVSVVASDETAERIQHEAAGVEVGGRLELLRLDARALVDELVRKVTRLGSFADSLLRNPSYESLVEIVPGVREMAIFHTLEKKRRDRFDRIVLDAPATGHGIHFLEAPEKTARILAGPLRERAVQLRDWLKDPDSIDVVIVTLAEETPVRETMELATTLRRQGFPLDNIVVNRWFPKVFVDDGARRALASVIEHPPAGGEAWARGVALVAAQRAEAEAHLADLRRLDVKLAIVPLIPDSSRRLLRVAEAMRAGGAGVAD